VLHVPPDTSLTLILSVLDTCVTFCPPKTEPFFLFPCNICTLFFREDRLLILPYCIALAMFVCATETVSYETSQLVKRLKRWHTTVGCKIDKPDPARRLGTPNLQKNPCNFMESSEPSQPILDFFQIYPFAEAPAVSEQAARFGQRRSYISTRTD
jgi:hypothetical protein